MKQRLDEYLDGLLSGEDRAAFEREMARDPALAEAARVQGAIDADLRAGLAYEPRVGGAPALRLAGGGQLPVTTAPAAPRVAGRVGDWKRQAAAVAALVMLAAGVIWMNLSPGPRGPAAGAIAEISPETAFTNLVAGGFKPEFVCTTDVEFAKAVKDRFGQALLVAATPSVELLGWAYDAGYRTRVLGDMSLILMAKAEGREVIVLMDKVEHDRAMPPPTAAGLHLHRRVVGRMVVYEVSHAATPVILDKVYDPEAGK